MSHAHSPAQIIYPSLPFSNKNVSGHKRWLPQIIYGYGHMTTDITCMTMDYQSQPTAICYEFLLTSISPLVLL